MATKYQVERRPISPSGKVYRGTGFNDFIMVATNPENLSNAGLVQTTSTSQDQAKIIPPNGDIPKFGGTSPAKTFFQEVNGEPWLVHSSHFSIEAALESAAPLAGALGQENVRIVKVLSHRTKFTLQ